MIDVLLGCLFTRRLSIKKLISQEVSLCDFCESQENCYHYCRLCGKDVCYKCRGGCVGVEYRHGVYIQGSGDGFYCQSCDVAARKANDKLHAAYLVVQCLRNEAAGWSADFDKRRKAAEEVLDKLEREDEKR